MKLLEQTELTACRCANEACRICVACRPYKSCNADAALPRTRGV